MSSLNELDIKILESEPRQFTCSDCEDFNLDTYQCSIYEGYTHPDSDTCGEFALEEPLIGGVDGYSLQEEASDVCSIKSH